MKLGLVAACMCAAVLGFVGIARAEQPLPVVVEYVAPPECASTEAFHALLQAQIARMPNPDRPWRFEVGIRHGDDYEGTVSFAAGSRQLHAQTCDDLVAALTFVIAMATPTPPAPPPPVVPLLVAAPATRMPDRIAPREDQAMTWRIGARIQDWTNGAWLSAVGSSGVVSIEPQWGHYRMMFELGAGVLVSSFATPSGAQMCVQGPCPSAHFDLTWGVADFQACPLDYELGRTGLAILGCTRFAGAVNRDASGSSSGAMWVGAGGRLRWQTPFRVYLEAHANGLWGTQSSPLYGSPGWMDFGAGVGASI